MTGPPSTTTEQGSSREEEEERLHFQKVNPKVLLVPKYEYWKFPI